MLCTGDIMELSTNLLLHRRNNSPVSPEERLNDMFRCVLNSLPHGHGEGVAHEEIWDVGWIKYITQDRTLSVVQSNGGYGDEGNLVHKRVYRL